MRVLILTLTCFYLASCATGEAFKRLNVNKDAAQLYIYKTMGLGGEFPSANLVFINNQEMTTLLSGNYVVHTLPDGEHQIDIFKVNYFSNKKGNLIYSEKFNLEKGKVYFLKGSSIRLGLTKHMSIGGQDYRLVDKEKALNELPSMKLSNKA